MIASGTLSKIVMGILALLLLLSSGGEDPMASPKGAGGLTSSDPSERAQAACEMGLEGVSQNQTLSRLMALLGDEAEVGRHLQQAQRLYRDMGARLHARRVAAMLSS